MHPRVFLDSFWRSDIRHQVFVAMPFGGKFDERFSSIYKPAINSIEVITNRQANPPAKQKLSAYRVDNSKTGDSILTEIMDGVAHSSVILADISEYGRWVDEEGNLRTTPNGNVMYEVGLALACRHQTEVLLVRDSKDKGKILFDVSTIPHLDLEFDKQEEARSLITEAIIDRINERDWTKSTRLAMVLSTLSQNEIKVIRQNKDAEALAWAQDKVNFLVDNALPGLLEKGILRFHGIREDHQAPVYTWTDFGNIVRSSLPDIIEIEKTKGV